MRYFTIAILMLALVGCRKESNKPMPIEEDCSRFEIQVEPPIMPKNTPPVPPSSDFLRGYWDGYHGVWLGPLSWTLSSQYRNGYMIGKDHRHKGMKPQYPLKSS